MYTDVIDSYINEVKSKIILGLIIILFIIMIMGWFFSSKISNRLVQISETLDQEAEKVARVAEVIALESKNLTESTSKQAAALQETSSSLEETSSMIEKTSDNSFGAMKMATSSQQAAQKGKQIVSDMLSAMKAISQGNADIKSQIDESNKEISQIVNIINDIENKTKVINEIVFQTKLLSFNASVEAARAGEMGKGFSVVAEEVGNLAVMSGNAAKEISSMLSESVQKVEQTVRLSKENMEKMMSKAIEKVNQGSTIASSCEVVLEQIVGEVQESQRMMTEISTAAKEQTYGVGEINKAMAELDMVAQKNNSASTKTSESANELNHQVISLRQMTADLYETVYGEKKVS